MEDNSQPDKAALPKAPIPVEESRAQRLQRQQARFRDRGGIFVPSNRNTLVDILLGRKAASPKKTLRGRSASLSPRKPESKGNGDATKALRTSPRKAAQGRTEGESAVAGRAKARQKPARSNFIFCLPYPNQTEYSDETEKPSPKRRGSPTKPKPKADDDERMPDDDPPPKAKVKRTTKAPQKRTTKKAEPTPAMDTPIENEPLPVPVKPKPKRSTKSATKATKEPLTNAAGPSANTSTRHTTKPPAPKRVLETIPESEDEVDDAPSKARTKPMASTAPTLAPAIPKTSKEVKESLVEGADNCALLSTLGRSEVEGNRNGKGKKKAHLPVLPMESDEALSSTGERKGKGKAKAQSTTVEKSERSPTVRTKRARETEGEERTAKKSRVAVEETEDEEVEMDEPPPKPKPKTKPKPKPKTSAGTKVKASSRAAQAVGGERIAAEDDEDKCEMVEPVIPERVVSHTQNKRLREPEKDNGGRVKRAKIDRDTDEDDEEVRIRKTGGSPDTQKARKPGPAKRPKAKASAAESSKASRAPSKSKSKSKAKAKAKSDPDPSTDTYIKLNSEPDSQIISTARFKPRKSVMQRIKEPLPQIEDDDPDPIDFLC
ncbi:hypothetical protein D9615_007685 [Tricholomella constricta]|uniref:Uncharacterized protein n=1 Tax=Tricholomella constricta TaxID=117010 RepID=A0A8H5H3L4_9AGAR|nr:hypothetical protein D9615_007685 [Tricholomella constricta]